MLLPVLALSRDFTGHNPELAAIQSDPLPGFGSVAREEKVRLSRATTLHLKTTRAVIRLRSFYKCPITRLAWLNSHLHSDSLIIVIIFSNRRFTVDFLSYGVLLLLYSYAVLESMQNDLSAVEVVIIVWFITLLIEEIHEVSESTLVIF